MATFADNSPLTRTKTMAYTLHDEENSNRYTKHKSQRVKSLKPRDMAISNRDWNAPFRRSLLSRAKSRDLAMRNWLTTDLALSIEGFPLPRRSRDSMFFACSPLASGDSPLHWLIEFLWEIRN